MGVDASYLYGYGADISEIEWDIEYLKEKYKDKLNEVIDEGRYYKTTWIEFINKLEESLVDNEYVSEILEDIGNLIDINYDDEQYLTFNHKHIAKLYPNSRLCEVDDFAKLYAKELGIKNIECISWIEWGYFS